MSSTELLQPILKGGLRSVNFVNGRLLTGEDLTEEQNSNREGRRRLGQALGEGVAAGLQVSENAALSTKQAPVITVSAGLAVNRDGVTLKLAAATDISLVRSSTSQSDASSSRLFKNCQPTEQAVYVAGAGAYLLTVCPAEGGEGRAPISGLDGTTTNCNTRYTVEGVQFRLLQLNLAANELEDASRLRNHIAYKCFGIETLTTFERDPFGAQTESYGLLDSLRPNNLTDCDVPLAIIYWTATGGLNFIDMWAARRRVTEPAASDNWRWLIADRRSSEAEAMFLQFQDQLAGLHLSLGNVSRMRAEEHFLYLPPAGLLPTGANNFDWRTFLGPHAPPDETIVDEGLLRSILDRALACDPVQVNAFADASKPGLAPPVPLNVYRLSTSNNYVLFARSTQGRIRVFVRPANIPVRPGQLSAESSRNNLRHQASIVSGGVYPIVELAPGAYKVDLSPTGFQQVSAPNVPVVAGQTTDVAFTLQLSGSVLLTILNDVTGASIGSRVQSIKATPTQGGQPVDATPAPNDKWQIINISEGTYKIEVTATNYLPGAPTNVVVTAGQQVNLIIRLQPVPVVPGSIALTVVDQSGNDSLDSQVESATARDDQNQTYPGHLLSEGQWVITNLPPGIYSVSVNVPEYIPSVTPNVEVEPNKLKSLNVVMQRVPALPGSIELTIKDKRTGANIDTKVQSVKATDTDNSPHPGTFTNGRWTIPNLIAGTYVLTIVATDYETATINGVAVVSGQQKSINVEMQAVPGSLEFSVTDQKTGGAIDSLVQSVTATDAQNNSYPGAKGGNGKWSIVNLQPGLYTVAVAATHYDQRTAANIEVKSNRATAVTIPLPPRSGSIQLMVKDALTDAPISESMIAVVWPVNRINTITNGQCLLPDIPPGDSTLDFSQFTAPKSLPDTSIAVHLSPEEQVSILVKLPRQCAHYTFGTGGQHNDKPVTTYTYCMDIPVVMAWPLPAPFDSAQYWTSTESVIKVWLRTWRDWLIQTRPDLGVVADDNQPPAFVSRMKSPSTSADEYGYAVFVRANGQKIGLSFDKTVVTTIGRDDGGI